MVLPEDSSSKTVLHTGQSPGPPSPLPPSTMVCPEFQSHRLGHRSGEGHPKGHGAR